MESNIDTRWVGYAPCAVGKKSRDSQVRTQAMRPRTRFGLPRMCCGRAAERCASMPAIPDQRHGQEHSCEALARGPSGTCSSRCMLGNSFARDLRVASTRADGRLSTNRDDLSRANWRPLGISATRYGSQCLRLGPRLSTVRKLFRQWLPASGFTNWISLMGLAWCAADPTLLTRPEIRARVLRHVRGEHK